MAAALVAVQDFDCPTVCGLEVPTGALRGRPNEHRDGTDTNTGTEAEEASLREE